MVLGTPPHSHSYIFPLPRSLIWVPLPPTPLALIPFYFVQALAHEHVIAALGSLVYQQAGRQENHRNRLNKNGCRVNANGFYQNQKPEAHCRYNRQHQYTCACIAKSKHHMKGPKMGAGYRLHRRMAVFYQVPPNSGAVAGPVNHKHITRMTCF